VKEVVMFTLRPALVLLAMFTVLTGVLYPAFVTAAAQVLFPDEAGGSLIAKQGEVQGSLLIGQPFTSPGYFWSRPSATSPVPYNAASSAGSNLGPLHPALAEGVKQRLALLRASDPAAVPAVPVDLVTASASGLDPHISPAAAGYQIARVAAARGLERRILEQLVEAHAEERVLGVLGERRVNVLQLNLALDALR
jgi:K+-transporting ATPase ATPase C chain